MTRLVQLVTALHNTAIGRRLFNIAYITLSAFCGTLLFYGIYFAVTDPTARAIFFSNPLMFVLWVSLVALTAILFFWLSTLKDSTPRPVVKDRK